MTAEPHVVVTTRSQSQRGNTKPLVTRDIKLQKIDKEEMEKLQKEEAHYPLHFRKLQTAVQKMINAQALGLKLIRNCYTGRDKKQINFLLNWLFLLNYENQLWCWLTRES